MMMIDEVNGDVGIRGLYVEKDMSSGCFRRYAAIQELISEAADSLAMMPGASVRKEGGDRIII